MRKSTLILIFFILSYSFLNSIIINIPADQPTIQAGLDIANEGDTVLVATGTYFENIIWPITNGIELIGIDRDSCIIDGNSTGSVISYEHWDVVHDSTNVIRNFTIQNGFWARGSGIYLRSDNQFLLENLTIKDNYLYNPVDNNKYCIEGGSGIHLDNNSSPIMRNILICDNYSELDGGGIFLYENSEPVMENVTIVNNQSETNGGGIFCDHNSNPNSRNCIIWNNYPQEIFTLNDSISINYTDILNGWSGSGNIDSDPLFVNAMNGDYQLTEYSPCIDAGDPDSPLDPDGTISDMGALYYNQLVDTDENEIQIVKFNLSNFPNPFNPTTTISFSINTESSENVELGIYNIKGQKVKTFLINTSIDQPINSVIWNGKDEDEQSVASGIYFYQLNSDDKVIDSKKCLLLK